MHSLRYLLQPCHRPVVFGYLFFIGMMAVGYYYNLTFVQFGLLDLGTRVIGLSEEGVATNMAFLALLTTIIAIAVGVAMQRLGWSQRFLVKLRLAFGVVLVQTVLTAAAPFVRSEPVFFVWIVVASAALGVGVPATFSMTADLIHARNRGYVAALITALAYFAAATFSTVWQVEQFARQLLTVMLGGTLTLAMLVFRRWPFLETLAEQHRRPEFGRGRFVRVDRETGRTWVSRKVVGLVLLMFGIFFVDSLGFLRLADTPTYFEAAWQSPELNTRLVIAGFHVVAALAGGILYSARNERHLFLWIFGIFALVHLMYTFDIRLSPGNSGALAMPILYATAVSLYTVVSFAIWADISTPRTISRNTALGVGLAGWSATFTSTALALRLRLSGVSLEQHLNLVDALAMLFFLGVLAILLAPKQSSVRPAPRPIRKDSQ
ncbi:MAG: hypothetical protein M0Z94_12860 [Dehalococcoidales bacterium]|nr:hypothetical protein [Dehalococcoidales bacterium]